MKSWVLAFVAVWGLGLQLLAQPDNDHFANRQRLAGAFVTTPFYLLDATEEPGEAAILETHGESIWFEWIAPGDGHFQVREPHDPPRNSRTILLRGGTFAQLQRDHPTLGSPSPIWECRRGETLQIALVNPPPTQGSGLSPDYSYTGVLEIEYLPRPTNDRFENRIPLGGDNVVLNAWVASAEKDPRDPNQVYGLAWWSWTAPGTGEVEITARPNSPTPWIGVFQGNQLGKLQLVASNNWAQPRLSFPVVAGQDYQLAVADGFYGRTQLNLSLTRPLRLTGVDLTGILQPPLSVELGLDGIVHPALVTNLQWRWSNGTKLNSDRLVTWAIPELIAGDHFFTAWADCSNGTRYHLPETTIRLAYTNDSFATPGLLQGDRIEFTADTRGATQEPGEPPLPGQPGSLWWRWVAPYSGRIGDAQPGYNMEFWSGNEIDQLTTVTNGIVEEGAVYRFRIAGDIGFSQYHFELAPLPVPNDSITNSLTLTPNGATNRVELGAASLEPGEAGLADGASIKQSVWYSFKAPQSGIIRCEAICRQPVRWEVFADGSTNSLPPAFGRATEYTKVAANTLYRIRLAGNLDIPETRAEFRFNYLPSPPNDDFASATPLEGQHVSFAADLGGATLETGEPFGKPGAWWRWVAPRVGWVVLQPADGSHLSGPRTSGTVLEYGVFSGSAVDKLSCVPVAPASGEAVGFLARTNEIYFIRISGAAGDRPVNVRLDFSETFLAVEQAGVLVPPDYLRVYQQPWDFSLRIAVASKAKILAGESVTLRALMPGDSTQTLISWRQKIAVQAVPRFVSTKNLATDVSAALPFVVTNLPAGWNEFEVATTTAEGTVLPSLPIALLVRPENDDFGHAKSIVGYGASTPGTLEAATVESREPGTNTPATTRSVWFRWQAPASGSAYFRVLFGSPRLAIFQGAEFASLHPVITESSQLSTGSPWFQFPAEAGGVYWISVGKAVDPNTELQSPSFELEHFLSTTRWAKSQSVDWVEGDSIRLELESTVPTSAIDYCEFIADGSLFFSGYSLGRTYSPPWRLDWRNAAPGFHPITARIHLTSGEDLYVSSINLRIRARNLNPETPSTITNALGVLPYRPDPRQYGATNRAYYQWSAPAEGLLVIKRRLDFEVYPMDSNQVSTNLPNVAPPDAYWRAFRVVAGKDYRLAVETSEEIAFEFIPPILNDNFEKATAIIGDQFELRAIPWLASAQPGEPPHLGVPARHSQWWRWTAPSDGYLRDLTVYQGDSINRLIRISPNPQIGLPSPIPSSDSRRTRVTKGAQYRLVLDDGAVVSAGNYEIIAHNPFTPMLANDQFANRIPLTGRRISFSANLDLTTAEPNEPPFSPNNLDHTAWWTWTAPVSGPVRIRQTPNGTSFGSGLTLTTPLRVGVFRGTNLSPDMAQVSEGTIDRSSELTFPANTGESFQIRVGASYQGLFFPSTLELISEASPANDNFADRQTIPTGGGSIPGWNIGSSREFKEPSHRSQFGGRSVWYRWQPTESGTAIIKVKGELSPSLLAVYQGTRVDQLRSVDGLQFLNDGTAFFNPIVGHEYAIAVDGLFGATGDFTLETAVQSVAAAPPLTFVWSNFGPRLRFPGHPLLPLQLQATTDLVLWEPIANFTAGSVLNEFVMPTNSPTQFFRLWLSQ